MRSARMVLASATATAALAIAAPLAYANHMDDGEHDKSSYSKEHDKDSKHDKPYGGMHTGGGALSSVSDKDWEKGDDKYEDEDKKEEDKKEEDKKDDKYEGKHDKPYGGMHTGGGALALSMDKDWEKGDDKYEDKDEDKKYEDKDEDKKYEDKDEDKKYEDKYSSKHDKPYGGVHTGGGALALNKDWSGDEGGKYDSSETYKDKSEESWGKDKEEWKHDKPKGGMHTGGGGLAQPGVTAGGLAALAFLGTGMYALRRKKAAGSVA
ncbi:hypothetical protein GCM10009601_18640 [Streptomyces thermospinosisporus]|uniref:LPXTG cell wall anchor domain-containing protein n=1 Tax=Streptomyces thermospinosisporus TaxID=161482 RepID=A0ABP4JKM3_9ACTN